MRLRRKRMPSPFSCGMSDPQGKGTSPGWARTIRPLGRCPRSRTALTAPEGPPTRRRRPLPSPSLWSSPPSSSGSSSRSCSWWPGSSGRSRRSGSSSWSSRSYTFYGWWRFDTFHGRYCLLLIVLTVGNQVFAQAIWRAKGGSRRLPRRRGRRCGPRRPDLVQVRRVDLRDRQRRPRRHASPGRRHPADRHLVLHLPGHQLRGRHRPAASCGRSPLLDFAVYLSFFAHLVAGPIVRVGEFVPQLERPADPRYDRRRPGLPC